MTNWVETVQTQAYNGPSDLDEAQKMFEQMELESDEDEDDYGSEGFSDVKENLDRRKKRRNDDNQVENSGAKLAAEDKSDYDDESESDDDEGASEA